MSSHLKGVSSYTRQHRARYHAQVWNVVIVTLRLRSIVVNLWMRALPSSHGGYSLLLRALPVLKTVTVAIEMHDIVVKNVSSVEITTTMLQADHNPSI